MAKKLIASFLIFSFVITLCACDSYRNDIAVLEIEKKISNIVKNDNLSDQSELYISEIMQIDTSIFDEYSIKAPDDTSLDEYGIFKCKSSGDARDTAKKLKKYLEFRLDEWTGMYLQGEYPKLRDASVKAFGNYVVYLILDEDVQDTVYSKIGEMLKVKK